MKKHIICFILIGLMITPIIVCAADYLGDNVWAKKIDYQVKINGNTLNNISLVNININDGYEGIYIPIRPVCEKCGMKVEWKYHAPSEKTNSEINIVTDEEPTTDLMDSYGIELSKVTLANMADAVQTQKYGENFTKVNSIRTIEESTDGTSYIIHRHANSTSYKDYCITVGKSNGQMYNMYIVNITGKVGK